MPDIDDIPGNILMKPSLAGAGASYCAADNAAGNGGDAVLYAGNGGGAEGAGGTAGQAAGAGAGSNGGGDGFIQGGPNDVAGAAQVRATGADGVNGGDVKITPGPGDGDTGRNGVIMLLGPGGVPLPTTDPMVVDAIYKDPITRVVMVSAAT